MGGGMPGGMGGMPGGMGGMPGGMGGMGMMQNPMMNQMQNPMMNQMRGQMQNPMMNQMQNPMMNQMRPVTQNNQNDDTKNNDKKDSDDMLSNMMKHDKNKNIKHVIKKINTEFEEGKELTRDEVARENIQRNDLVHSVSGLGVLAI